MLWLVGQHCSAHPLLLGAGAHPGVVADLREANGSREHLLIPIFGRQARMEGAWSVRKLPTYSWHPKTAEAARSRIALGAGGKAEEERVDICNT